jgi:hypothetical protein
MIGHRQYPLQTDREVVYGRFVGIMRILKIDWPCRPRWHTIVQKWYDAYGK